MDKFERYRQAKTNALNSGKAFSRCLELVTQAASGRVPIVLAVHSLGATLFQSSIEKHSIANAVTKLTNLVLLAPDVNSANHAPWLTVARPIRKTYVTLNKNDWILAAAQFVDHEIKLGSATGNSAVSNGSVRYVDFTNSASGAGYRYFINPKDLEKTKTKQLFSRVFSGEADFSQAEGEKFAYRFGCIEPVCWMGNVPSQDFNA